MANKLVVCDDQGGINIKRVLYLREWEPYSYFCQWTQQQRELDRCVTTEDLIVGMKRHEIRLRYPQTTSRVRYLENPSQDLLALTSLFITNLVPVGVWADALEDSYPSHKDCADFVRKWATLKAEQDRQKEQQ